MRRVLQVIIKSLSVVKRWWRLSDPVILALGAMLGLALGLILLRGFIFNPGLPSWQDLTWPYSSHVFPQYYLWDEFRQAPVFPMHMLGYIFFYQFSAEASIRLMYLFLFTIMGMSTFYAVFKLTSPRHPSAKIPLFVSVLAVIVYIINPVILRNWTIWYILRFYAFIPLMFYLSYAALRQINSLKWADIFKKAIVIALVLFMMSPGGERFIHYTPLLLLAFFAGFGHPFLDYLKRSVALGGLILVLYVVFCSIWLIPLSVGAFNPSEFTTFSRNWFPQYSKDSNLYLSFNLMITESSYNAGCFRVSETMAPIRNIAVVLLPALAFCALLLRRSKLIVWLSLFALMFIFLAKGTNPPFGGFYEWLACDSPVISSFGMAMRQPVYWSLPLMICYTLLFSFTFSYLLGWMVGKLKWPRIRKVILFCFTRSIKGNRNWIGSLKWSNVKATFLVMLIAILVVVFFGTPFFTGLPLLTGDINGAFKPVKIGEEYIDLMRWLERDKEDYKVYYHPLMYWFSSGKPTLPVGSRLEGSHQSLAYVLIRDSLFDTMRYGSLLSPWNIKYFICSSGHVPEDQLAETLLQLESQKDLQLIERPEGLVIIDLYKNLENRSQVWAGTQAIAVQGGLESMLSLTAVDSYEILTHPMIFLDQNVVSSDYLAGVETLLSNQANLDLYLTRLDEKYMIKPFELINDDPNTVWMKARTRPTQGAEWTWWLNVFEIENWQSDYGVGIARSEGRSLNMSFKVDAAGEYDIFMRCIRSKKGGVLKVLLDHEPVGDVCTNGNVTEFEWVYVCTLDLDRGKHILTIDDNGGFNAVNLIAVLPDGELERYERQIDDMVANKRIVSIWEAETALNYLGANVSDGYGGNASNGEVLTMPPGSRAWRQIDVVRDGQYMIAVRLAGDMLVKMDDQVMPMQSADLGFAYTAPVYLMKGVHNVEVTPNTGEIDLDVVWLYTIEKEYESVEDIFISGENATQVVEFTKINPTKYRATVNATQPFMLSFAESYEHMWVARVNGKEYPSIPLNGVVNGFWIEDQGMLEITIEYKPQKYLYYGAIISLIGVIGALSFLIWDWRKRARASKAGGC